MRWMVDGRACNERDFRCNGMCKGIIPRQSQLIENVCSACRLMAFVLLQVFFLAFG